MLFTSEPALSLPLQGSVASRYRPGACANCGAMSHQAKDCVERPRKRGAKLTNKGICADEFIDSPALSYDGKRDRWNGYDPSSYKQVVSRTSPRRLRHL